VKRLGGRDSPEQAKFVKSLFDVAAWVQILYKPLSASNYFSQHNRYRKA
jgi:hypothetical protein